MHDSKKGRFLLGSTSLLLPIVLVFFLIGFHSHALIPTWFHYFLFLLVFSLVSLLISSIVILMRSKKRKKKEKFSKKKTILFSSFIGLEVIGATTFLTLLYGPISTFRTFLISSAMTTMNHHYLATWFYSEKEIYQVLESNKIIETTEETNPALIEIHHNFNRETYANEYERQIFTIADVNAPYKIIPISGKNYEGYMAVIYDPSRVTVGTTQYLEKKGEYVTEMAYNYNALLAVNGGGFSDPYQKGTGGSPEGVLIQNGQVLADKSFDRSGGLIGFTEDDKLILGKMTAKEALEKKVRDAVSFGPFLIVNGQKSIIKGNGGWGNAPRTAIGQRQDGIVLLLVLDGRKVTVPGATMLDLTNVLANYGAYNAANLDGGTSTVMVLPKEKASNYITEKEMKSHCLKGYCYINDIVNGSGAHVTRPVVSSIIVK